ncbi:MAG: tetratricopeptide repeat protein [Planctomycetaceae bacterium]
MRTLLKITGDSFWLCALTSLSLLTVPVFSVATAAAVEPFAQDEAKPAQEDPGIPGLQEPDPTKVRDESEAIDPSNKDALAWYMAGQKALKSGQLEEAEESFRNAAKADPKSAIPLRALAMVLFRRGQVENGLKTANEAMTLDPDDYQTRLEMAVLFGSNRRFQDSQRLADEGLQSKNLKQDSFDFVHLHQIRGASLLQLRNAGAAADSYEVILNALEEPEKFQLTDRQHKTLLQNRITGYELTGRILLEAGRVPKAIKAFEAIARTEGNTPGEYNLLLARAFYLQDKLKECEENLTKYFETGRRSNEALVLLRDLYQNTERSSELNAMLEKLSEDTSQATPVRMFLGQVLLDQGKNTEAAEVYQTILDTTGDPDAYLGLVRVEIANRNPDALIATLNRAARARISPPELAPLVTSMASLDEFSRDTIKACLKTYEEKPEDLQPAVPWFCALVANEIEDTKLEAELLKTTLELNPDRELMLETLDKYGLNQLAQGEYEMSAKIFEQMLEMPGLPPGMRVNTLYRISAAYASIKDLKAARAAINEALKMVPNEPQLVSRLALIEAADGNLKAAENLLIQAIGGLAAESELLIEARIRLAGIYAQQDNWENCIEQYETILEIEKLDKETKRLALMGLSNAWVQSGDMEKGQKVLEDVYAEDPTDPGINNDLGYLYADQGKNLEQAEKMVRVAVEAQPENPAYLDSLGWVLFKQGKFTEALEPLKKANSDPDYQDATLLEHQGDVHEALKQMTDAKAMWQRALDVEQKATKPDEKIVARIKEKLAKPDEEKK